MGQKYNKVIISDYNNDIYICDNQKKCWLLLSSLKIGSYICSIMPSHKHESPFALEASAVKRMRKILLDYNKRRRHENKRAMKAQVQTQNKINTTDNRNMTISLKYLLGHELDQLKWHFSDDLCMWCFMCDQIDDHKKATTHIPTPSKTVQSMPMKRSPFTTKICCLLTRWKNESDDRLQSQHQMRTSLMKCFSFERWHEI